MCDKVSKVENAFPVFVTLSPLHLVTILVISSPGPSVMIVIGSNAKSRINCFIDAGVTDISVAMSCSSWVIFLAVHPLARQCSACAPAEPLPESTSPECFLNFILGALHFVIFQIIFHTFHSSECDIQRLRSAHPDPSPAKCKSSPTHHADKTRNPHLPRSHYPIVGLIEPAAIRIAQTTSASTRAANRRSSCALGPGVIPIV